MASHAWPYRVVQTLLIACCICVLANAAAAAPQSPGEVQRAYDDARAYYLKLSRDDPKVTDLMEWERAASDLLTFVRNHEDANYTPRALHLLGRLYEHTYLQRKFRTGLSRAVYFYEQLAKDYRGNPLADDALLYLGDLRRGALKDEVAAKAAYYEIVDVYPDGDMVEKARARLGLKANQKPKPPGERGTPADSKLVKEVPTETDAPPPATAEEVPIAPTPEPVEENTGLLAIFNKRKNNVGEEGKEIFSSESAVRRPVIVIDPGHGGIEEGAHGVSGIMEKEVVLSIAMMLDELLRERLRARTVLTRSDDRQVPLQERTRIANDQQADLFISVHANASEFKTAFGIETYFLDNTNDKSSLKLAERENQSVAATGESDLSFILSDLIQNAKLDDSITLAHQLQDSMTDNLSRYYKGIKNLGVKKAPFYVLVGAHMPCVLVEVSFIDHPVEGARLGTRRYQKLIAASLYEGIRAYFEKH